MNWHQLRKGSPLKLVEYEDGRTPKEERITIAQRVPLNHSIGVERSVSVVLADLAVLPNTERLNPRTGELMREGTLAVIPVRPSEGLWQPDASVHGEGVPEAVEGPGGHPYVDECLREWKFWHGLGVYSVSSHATIGRNARQKGGAEIGVQGSHTSYALGHISRRRGVVVSTLRNQIGLNGDHDPESPIHVHRQSLWAPAPDKAPLGNRLAIVNNVIPSQTVVDALEEMEQWRVNNFYGQSFLGWRRAWKRFQLQREGKSFPEVASPWIGASTALTKV